MAMKCWLQDISCRDNGDGEAGGQRNAPTVMSDKEISESVDSILLDNDAHRDGYIDYPEFIVAQRVEGGR
jgi:Ca2+-binding EF-hand superfamily protein